MKYVVLILLVLLSTVALAQEKTGQVTFAWDANDPKDEVIGYKIYYGKQSRFDENLDPEARTVELAKKNCGGNQECIDSWHNYCTDPKDQMCDYDWFDYDTKIDVENVLEYTITLPAGKYFFAATAYDKTLESKFSIELEHEIEFDAPGKPLNFKGMMVIPLTSPTELKLTDEPTDITIEHID